LSEYAKRQIEIKKLLNIKIDDDDYDDGIVKEAEINDRNTSYINDDILNWLLRLPKTDGFKILGFIDANNFEKMTNLPENKENMHIFIMMEYKTRKLLLQVKTKLYMGMVYLDDVRFVGKYDDVREPVITALEMLIIRNFIQTFDIKKNVLEFNGHLVARERTKVDEKINQYDIKPLVKNIRKVLKNGRKRGRVFIGRQGTGKSSIIRKLEEILTDIIIIKLSPDEFFTSSSIKRCFEIIKTIQPALVIIEDMDSCRFKDKNERVGTFINEIDDSNNDLNIFLLVTINDPDLVHKTIIDRPGRFDEVEEIKPPQTVKEAYEVMKSKYDKLRRAYTEFEKIDFPKQKDIDEKIIKQCVDQNFTQAELTSGIIENVFINVDDANNFDFNTEIANAVELFQKSKTSLKTYKFNIDDEELPENNCCEEAADNIEDKPVLKKTVH